MEESNLSGFNGAADKADTRNMSYFAFCHMVCFGEIKSREEETALCSIKRPLETSSGKD